MYVYIRSEPGLWTVGFYRPDGKWESASDHDSPDEAAARVAWLNGSRGDTPRTYSLGEIREGTGWAKGARFALVQS